MASRSAEEVMTEREATMHAIEQLATEMAANGSKKAWSKSVRDPALKRFAEEVHGPMLLRSHFGSRRFGLSYSCRTIVCINYDFSCQAL